MPSAVPMSGGLRAISFGPCEVTQPGLPSLQPSLLLASSTAGPNSGGLPSSGSLGRSRAMLNAIISRPTTGLVTASGKAAFRQHSGPFEHRPCSPSAPQRALPWPEAALTLNFEPHSSDWCKAFHPMSLLILMLHENDNFFVAQASPFPRGNSDGDEYARMEP